MTAVDPDRRLLDDWRAIAQGTSDATRITVSSQDLGDILNAVDRIIDALEAQAVDLWDQLQAERNAR